MFNFIDSLNTVYEIRDEGTRTRYFFVGNNEEFKQTTPKSLSNYTVKIINQSIYLEIRNNIIVNLNKNLEKIIFNSLKKIIKNK